jgi:dihydrofolate reductase
MGNIIIMGRMTFESLPDGPLKDRLHIVLTRTPVVSSFANVIFIDADKLRETLEPYKTTKKIFVIGGREIYDLLFDYCDIFHITVVDMEPEGDVAFSYDLDYLLKHYMTLYSSEWFVSKKGVSYKYFTFYRK